MPYRCLILIAALLFLALPVLAADEPSGEDLVRAWGCRSCHRIKNFGGSLAADLSRVGRRLNAIDIRLKLHPLPGQNKGALMPTFPEMPDNEVRILSDYLSKLK